MNYFLLKLAFDTAVHFGGSDSAVGSQSSALTLRADTIFSALCHTALEVYGEPALEELLVSADADALRISDAMPWRGDTFYLPKPIAASTSPAELSTVERKAVKKLAWIPASKFDRYTASLHSGTYPLDELDQSFGQAYEQTKASVTDGADAKPYFVGLYRLHAGCGLYVLCACEGNDQLKMLKELFTLLGLSGIGGRTSAGYGRFHLDGEPICLNTAEDASLRWMLQALERGTAPYLLLTSSLPTGEEMDAALEGAAFQLARRGGFASTEWVETCLLYTSGTALGRGQFAFCASPSGKMILFPKKKITMEMPPVICASPRRGILYWNRMFRLGLPRFSPERSSRVSTPEISQHSGLRLWFSSPSVMVRSMAVFSFGTGCTSVELVRMPIWMAFSILVMPTSVSFNCFS